MVKNKILTLISALAIILSMSTFSVKADGNESGFAVGGIFNSSTFDTSGSETETTGDQETNSTSISKGLEFASIFAEGVLRQGTYGFNIGVEYIPGEAELGAKVRADTTTAAAESDQSDGDYHARAQLSDHFTGYVEPTVYVTPNIGLFVKAGMSRVTVETLESIDIGTDSSSYGNANTWGTVLGIGVRLTHSSGMFVKADYSETDYDSITLKSSTGNKNTVTAEPDQDSYRFSIGYKF